MESAPLRAKGRLGHPVPSRWAPAPPRPRVVWEEAEGAGPWARAPPWPSWPTAAGGPWRGTRSSVRPRGGR
eukprot:1156762-Lingulodinium_polyedra.AAC.1